MSPESEVKERGPAPLRQDLALHGELSANVVGFCRLLRDAGTSVGPGEESDALRALRHIDLGRGDAFYYCLRTALAKSVREQRIFDDRFASYWGVWDQALELDSGKLPHLVHRAGKVGCRELVVNRDHRERPSREPTGVCCFK